MKVLEGNYENAKSNNNKNYGNNWNYENKGNGKGTEKHDSRRGVEATYHTVEEYEEEF